jgi:general secretion pathway protein G
LFVRIATRHSYGWTLIELLMALIVAGVLVGIATSSYASARQRAMTTLAKADLSMLLQAIERHRAANITLPASLADVGMAGLRDPWGNPYEYLNFAQTKGKSQMRKDHNLVPINSEFDLYSMGPDGSSQAPLTAKVSRDDIIVANDGGYIGLASEY